VYHHFNFLCQLRLSDDYKYLKNPV